jgi:hypothetical protein
VISENRRSFLGNAGALSGAAFAGRLWDGQTGATSVVALGGGPIESWGKSHAAAKGYARYRAKF